MYDKLADLLVRDLIGSNTKREIGVIVTSDVICCIDVPLIITISLVIAHYTQQAQH